MLHPVFHRLQLRSRASVAAYLRPSRYAWLYEVTHHVTVDEPGVLHGLFHHVGARAHHRHVATQYIVELWKFVYIGVPQESSYACHAGIVTTGLATVAIGRDGHCPEFPAIELLAVMSCAALAEEYRAFRCRLYGKGDRQEYDRK